MAEKEYIEREAAYKACEAYFSGVCVYDVSASEVINEFENVIEAVPTADVAPVRHGYWEPGDIYDIGDVCSICQYDSLREPCKYKYCPNCGAKMDGDTNGS